MWRGHGGSAHILSIIVIIIIITVPFVFIDIRVYTDMCSINMYNIVIHNTASGLSKFSVYLTFFCVCSAYVFRAFSRRKNRGKNLINNGGRSYSYRSLTYRKILVSGRRVTTREILMDDST